VRKYDANDGKKQDDRAIPVLTMILRDLVKVSRTLRIMKILFRQFISSFQVMERSFMMYTEYTDGCNRTDLYRVLIRMFHFLLSRYEVRCICL